MAAELKSALQVEPELISGKGGIYDVKVNGKMVFSKHVEGGRFPEDGEVLQRIRLG